MAVLEGITTGTPDDFLPKIRIITQAKIPQAA